MRSSFREANTAGLATAAALLFATAASAQLGFNYTVNELIDPRPPLEIPDSERLAPYDTFYLPVLFDQAVNSLEMVRINLSLMPPVTSSIAIATGSLFALGSATEINDTVGFSFIDGAFDLRFGGCTDPCTSTFNHLVSAGTWIDSSSAASANTRFVAGLDNAANHGIKVFQSTDNGATWSDYLPTFVPADPGGVYDNFHGGKRIVLTVDRNSTDPSTMRNCLLYETRPSATANSRVQAETTDIHLFCRNGSTPVFNAVLDHDVPNSSNVFDRFLEARGLMRPNGGGGLTTDVVYTSRLRQQFDHARVVDSGAVDGPHDLDPVPTGNAFYNPSLYNSQLRDALYAAFASGDDLPGRTSEWDPIAGVSLFAGPPLRSGPYFTGVAFDQNVNGAPHNLVFAAGRYFADPRTEGTEGLGLTIAELPIFFDGFETQNVLRWSSHVP